MKILASNHKHLILQRTGMAAYLCLVLPSPLQSNGLSIFSSGDAGYPFSLGATIGNIFAIITLLILGKRKSLDINRLRFLIECFLFVQFAACCALATINCIDLTMPVLIFSISFLFALASIIICPFWIAGLDGETFGDILMQCTMLCFCAVLVNVLVSLLPTILQSVTFLLECVISVAAAIGILNKHLRRFENQKGDASDEHSAVVKVAHSYFCYRSIAKSNRIELSPSLLCQSIVSLGGALVFLLFVLNTRSLSFYVDSVRFTPALIGLFVAIFLLMTIKALIKASEFDLQLLIRIILPIYSGIVLALKELFGTGLGSTFVWILEFGLFSLIIIVFIAYGIFFISTKRIFCLSFICLVCSIWTIATFASSMLSSFVSIEQTDLALSIIVTLMLITFAITPGLVQWQEEKRNRDSETSCPPPERANRTSEAIACQYGLSLREKEVLCFLIRGYGSRYVAEALFISDSTVRGHIRNIYQKIGIHNKTELIQIVESYASSSCQQ